MQLDLNFEFKDLKGNVLPGSVKASQFLGDMLAGRTGDISLGKAMLWANDLTREHKIEIDKPDLELLEKFVESANKNPNVNCPNLLAYPLLEAMKKAKEEVR